MRKQYFFGKSHFFHRNPAPTRVDSRLARGLDLASKTRKSHAIGPFGFSFHPRALKLVSNESPDHPSSARYPIFLPTPSESGDRCILMWGTL